MDATAIINYLSDYGMICIFVIIFLEYLNLPGFPAGIIMPLAGVWTASTGSNFFIALGVSVIAGVIGSWMLYFIGLYGGDFVMDKYTKRFPRHKIVIDKSMNRLKKYGNIGVFICKLMPAVRTIISVPAGVLKLNFIKYTVYSALGILIWNGVFISFGYFFGDVVMQALK
ncbi:MAG: DedA family protein [Clostridium sp.]|uniref:DedA family protein n=1 Tax=Clostridium sp. TaxID=1506 RepID=UPI003056A35C